MPETIDVSTLSKMTAELKIATLKEIIALRRRRDENYTLSQRCHIKGDMNGYRRYLNEAQMTEDKITATEALL